MAFPNLSDIIATTIQNRSGALADNVTNNNAVLKYLSKKGNVKPIDGGNVILQEIAFAQNGNAGFYSGYETLPTAAQDVISAAQFNIAQAACPVTISGLELLQNSGKEQIINLLESRISVAEKTMQNLIAQGIYSDGTGYGGKQITGLQAALNINPTTGVYGGIDRATWSFWRNQKFKATTDGGAATTSANIQGYFNNLYAKLVRGGDSPNLILVDQAYWSLYVSSLQALQRFTTAENGEAGFASLKFMGADVVLDSAATGIPTKTAFFLNTDYLFLRPHKDRNFVALNPEARYSTNQDAQTSIIGWAGNLTCSNLSLQGIMQE